MNRKAFASVGKFILTLSIGAGGGWVMWHFHMPLAWLLGAMIFCGVAALLKAPLAMPKFARPPMTATIGAMLGTSFSPAVFEHAQVWLVSLGGLVVFISVATSLAYVYFRKVGDFDHPTAFFSAMPVGLVEMVVLGAERGEDERMISLIHAARIFLVVLCLPFLIQMLTGQEISRGGMNYVPISSVAAIDIAWFAASIAIGAGLGVLLRLPAAYLLGPMLISAGLHMTGVSDFLLPSVFLSVAQVVIGATVGCRFISAAPGLILRVCGFPSARLSCSSVSHCCSLSWYPASREIVSSASCLPIHPVAWRK
ncbi:AbrB family transcriptional regulator [Pararhizobium sp. BT-229]|nr:AbrB family transcriptional regulator [Pararhizobium sp. BT-229]